ncbi:MAG: hypothetical protein ACNA7T_08855 [Haliea sp.]
MPVIALDDDLRILSMSPAALRLHDVTLEEVLGMTLIEAANREAMVAVLPPTWRRQMAAPKATSNGVANMLTEVARQHGNATVWAWIVTPKGRMFRCIINMIRLKQGYLLYLANVEDPFNRSVARAEQDGTIVGSRGARWTLETIQIFEDYISGSALHQIATDHGLNTSRVRAILEDIAEQAGFESAGAMRLVTFNMFAEEMIPSRHTILRVLSDYLPGFPGHLP